MELNQQPADYKSAALPVVLQRHFRAVITQPHSPAAMPSAESVRSRLAEVDLRPFSFRRHLRGWFPIPDSLTVSNKGRPLYCLWSSPSRHYGANYIYARVAEKMKECHHLGKTRKTWQRPHKKNTWCVLKLMHNSGAGMTSTVWFPLLAPKLYHTKIMLSIHFAIFCKNKRAETLCRESTLFD